MAGSSERSQETPEQTGKKVTHGELQFLEQIRAHGTAELLRVQRDAQVAIETFLMWIAAKHGLTGQFTIAPDGAIKVVEGAHEAAARKIETAVEELNEEKKRRGMSRGETATAD